MCPDACHFAECVVGWVWLPMDDPSLFLAGTTPGRAVLPPDWKFMAARLDFRGGTTVGAIGKRERCIRGGCPLAAVCLRSGNNEAVAYGWGLKSYNKEDPVEVALAAGVRSSSLAHVTCSTGAAYAGPWQHFGEWCSSLARPRCPLPADDFTVALYLQSVVDW